MGELRHLLSFTPLIVKEIPGDASVWSGLGEVTSLSQYPATPSTPRYLIFGLNFVEANPNHKMPAHQTSSVCKASILFEKELKFTSTPQVLLVPLITTSAHALCCSLSRDLRAISYDFSCILTLLFHLSAVRIVLSVITTPRQLLPIVSQIQRK